MKKKAFISLFGLLVVLWISAWAVSADVPKQQPTLATPVAVVNVSFLNLRTGPGPQYSIITQLVGGSTVPVIGANSDSSWFLVTTPAGNGWVYTQFTLARGDFRFVPELDAPPLGGTVTVTTTYSIGLNTVTTVTTTTTVTQSQAIQLPVPVIAAPQVVVNTSFLNIRSGPAGYFGVIATASGGDQFTAAAISSDGAWFLIEGAGVRGWVDSDFVLFRGVIQSVPIIYTS